MWTNHYNQPPNSTLGGIHKTCGFVEGANPTRNSPNWPCGGKQWLPKMHSNMVENFPFHLFKPLGWIFLLVILGIVHKVNHLTR